MNQDADRRDPLSPNEQERYARHLVLPGIGDEGQRRLKAGRVLIVGVGGLGSAIAPYLAGAGVGQLGIVDHDTVSLSNLHRQVLYGMSDLHRPKVEAAQERLGELNPDIEVIAHRLEYSAETAHAVTHGYDVVVDGTDNFETRYVINATCLALGIPYVYGAIFRFQGQVSVMCRADAPCYQCVFPQAPPPETVLRGHEAGILGSIPGVIGTLQATETIKLIVEIGRPLIGRLLLMDAAEMRFEEIEIQRASDCPACGSGRGQVTSGAAS